MSLNVERLAKTLSKELSILLSREARDANLSAVTITEVRVTSTMCSKKCSTERQYT